MYEKKYSLRELADGAWAIEMDMVRAFLVAGTTSALLIDTGAGGVDLRGAVGACTGLPVRVVNTHGHFDHISGNGAFEMAFAHPMELAALSKAGFEAKPIQDGAGFDLGGRVLQAVSLPGHSPGSIGLWDGEAGLFFAGDCVARGRAVLLMLDGASVEAYARSLEKLLTLENAEHGGIVRHLYCAHGDCEADMQTVRDLLACARGAMDGSLPRETISGPMAAFLPADARLVRSGSGSIVVA